ncbi:MAG TPA: SAM-dependent methyltransferase [Chloroflexi bacterium]|nr:SAM-dependent methyltransferase [Chloroflexota bacterium]
MKSEQEPKSLSQKRFGQFAENYVTSQSHAKGYDLDQMVKIANPQADWLVLDVATGGGHTALKFAPVVKKVIATDITPEMLAAAQKFVQSQGAANVIFEPADAQNLPFEDTLFDLVTCRIAPHHFPDCVRFIQQGSRVLKFGGLLLVQDHLLPEDQTAAHFIDDFERLRDSSHNQAFSKSQWIQMFEQAGLQVIHTEEIIKRHQLFPWAERQGCSPETILVLTKMLKDAPASATKWLQVENLGTGEASFVNHHILIAGSK